MTQGPGPRSAPTQGPVMHRRLLAVVVLGGLLAGALWVWSRDSSGSRGGSVGSRAAGAQPASESPGPELAGPVADAAPAAEPAGEGLADERSAVEAPDAERARLQGAIQRPLEGRVIRPAGTPADEELHVVALSQPEDYAGFYRNSAMSMAVWGVDEGRSSRILATAEVGADGRFELQLPADATEVHLMATGRYLFARSTTRVALDEGLSPTLPAEVGAWISGRLVPPADATAKERDFEDTDLELAPDITVVIDTMQVGSIGTRDAETDAEGRFELRAVPSVSKLLLLVEPERLATRLVSGLQTEPGQHLMLDVPVTRGATLRGRVVDEYGRPVEGAEVEARFRGLLGEVADELRETETDAEGAFELAHVPGGRIELRASHEEFREGLLVPEQELVEGDLLERLEIVLKAGATITGRVAFPDGTPAAGAMVRASLDVREMQGGLDGLEFARNRGGFATAGEDGSFVIAGLHPRSLLVKASLDVDEGEHTGQWSVAQSNVLPGGDPIALVLEALLSLSGQVLDGAQQPVPSFVVRASLKGSGAFLGLGAETEERSFQDEEEGRFEADGLTPGTWEVTVSAEGFATSTSREVSLPRPVGEEPLVFVLAPGCVVRGVVLGPSGEPRAGARVSLELDMATRFSAMARGGIPEAHSDHEGRFELRGLDPGSLSLVAFADGLASNEPVACDLAAGEVLEDVVLKLRTGGILTGEVLDQGKPDAGKMVIVQRTPQYTSQHMLHTDAEGTFRVESLEPGKWQVVVTADLLSRGEGEETTAPSMEQFLGNMKMEMVDIFDGEETHVVLGEPPANPVRVQGRVVHAREPVPGAVVSFVPEGSKGMNNLKLIVTSEDGRFETELSGAGTYFVTVQKNPAMAQQVSIEFVETIPDTEEPYEFLLELPVGKVSGRVRGPDGELLAGCRVSIALDGGLSSNGYFGGHYQETATDDDGYYQLPYLRAGTYVVAAGGAPLGGLFGNDSAGGRVVRGGLAVAEGASVEGIDFRLETSGDLAGFVLDLGGAPVSGASVFVRDEGGRLLEAFSMLESDGSGKFLYRGLAPGRYTVSARTADRASLESAFVDVASGQTAEAVVSLASATVLRITVVGEGDQPLRASISVLNADGREVAAMRSMSQIVDAVGDGLSTTEQSVGPLPPGEYTVFARADGREAKKPLSLEGQPERKLKLRLR